MARWKAVLFDLDGTLYDFHRCWRQGTRSAIEDHLARFPAGESGALPAVLATLDHYNGPLFTEVDRGRLDLLIARRLRYLLTAVRHGWDTSDEAVEAFLTIHLERVIAAVQPRPDLRPTLRALKQQHHLRLGIVTNGPPDQQRAKLERLGVLSYFDPAAVMVSGERGYAKPDPRIFHDALSALKRSPQDALYVGDSWPSDVLGALATGLDVAWFNPDGKPRPDDALPPSPGTLYEIARLEEVLTLVDSSQ